MAKEDAQLEIYGNMAAKNQIKVALSSGSHILRENPPPMTDASDSLGQRTYHQVEALRGKYVSAEV